MTQLHHADRDDHFEPTNEVSDPITGTRPLVENREYETGRTSNRTWGVAARWIAFALMLILAILVLYWVSGDRMG